MGGKTSQTTQKVTIPPEVMARYNAVNARAENVANTPFQQYGGQFVAGLNPTQYSATGVIANAANAAPDFYNVAAGMTGAGAGAVNPGELDVQRYMSPYTQNVADTTFDYLRQQQAQEMQGATGNAIKSGAFGGDRSGLVAAQLARQQQLGTAQAMAPIYQQGYTQALGAAQQQQGVDLSSRQADAARLMQGGQQFANLGSGLTQNQLAAGQALLGAGTLEQQTNQADLQARYNEFLQERGYPFQVAQFLANIAMGTGALSGSTTTTTQPAPLLSDERAKTGIVPIGKTFDGQNIIKFRYKGSPDTHIGLSAQEVEKHKPEAVGVAGGYRTVDYDAATEDAERPRKNVGGAMGYDPNFLKELLASQSGKFASFYGQPGTPRGVAGNPGSAGFVPQGNLPVGKLVTAGAAPQQRPSGLAQAAQTGSQIAGLAKMGVAAKNSLIGSESSPGYLRSAWNGVTGQGEAPLNIADTADQRALDEEGWRSTGGRTGYNLGGPSTEGDTDAPEGIYAPIGPGLNIPDARQKNELKVAGAPPAAPKSALGDILGAAKTAAMFFADGGVIPTEEELPEGEKITLRAGNLVSPAAPAQKWEERHPFGLVPSSLSPNDQWLKNKIASMRNEEPEVPPEARAFAPAQGVVARRRFVDPPAGVAGRPEMAAEAGIPQRATPGVAGPGRGPQDAESAPWRTLFGDSIPDRFQGDKRKALGSENFWIPALAGLGSMLASRSPYLGNVIGEGLVGGTKAYTDLNKSQQEMGESRARTEAQMANIARQSAMDIGGRSMFRVLNPDGTYRIVSFAEYQATPAHLRMPIDPRKQAEAQLANAGVPGAATPPQIEAPAAGTGVPAPGKVEVAPLPPVASEQAPVKAPAAVAPVQPPPAQTASGVPTAIALMPQDKALAFKYAAQVANEDAASRAERQKTDVFGPQRAMATNATITMQKMTPLAANLLALPEGQNIATSGPFSEVVAPYIGMLNNLAEMATGRQGAVIDPKVLATTESVRKEINQLRSQAATDAQQRAVSALEEMANNMVSLKNSRGGQAKIISKILSDTQRVVDKDRWFAQWREAGSTAPGGEPGTFSSYANLTGEYANREFDSRYNDAFYRQEDQRLQKMMADKIPNATTAGGQKMTVYEYVARNAANLPAQQIVSIADRYGDNMMRYFGIDPKKVEEARRQINARQ